MHLCCLLAGKPNIVFILTDDQDQRMNSLDHMPKVQDLLIKEGTWFSRHYAPTALCCPARVSIWTGLLAHNHNVTNVKNGPFGGWQKIIEEKLNDNYLPIWLGDNGYKTYYTGKLYNGMEPELVENVTARGWTEADLLIGGKTYQYYDPAFQHITKNNWNNPEKVNSSFRGVYSTDKVGDYAYGYLKEAVKHDDPFFVGIAPVTPHSQVGNDPDPAGPPVPSKKYKGTLPHLDVPPADNYAPANRSGVNMVWELDPLNDKQKKILQEHYEARTEALLSVDDIVEGVVDILEKAGKLDNTYIIYSSDNGFHLGHHRLGPGKKFAFEEDINVPLIIRGPNVPKNRKTSIITAHVDLSPTILDIAGAKQRANFDGRPIPHTASALNQRETSSSDEHTNAEFWVGASYKFNNLNGTHPNTYKSLRLSSPTYDISYTVHCTNNSHELYDMQHDAAQMHNLHPSAPLELGPKNAFHAGTTEIAGYATARLLPRLDALLLVLKSCKAESCVQPWRELHGDGGVGNLREAMGAEWDGMYEGLYNSSRVGFTRCYKDGTIDLAAEGPMWRGGGRGEMVGRNQTQGTMEEEEEGGKLGWEGEGYWDDWE
ncbi:sulfatase [Polyplosphaeria fusca]|uniref:Sulfatase n=1 Tax=Polyplosphaeria fusca TaxID=682080 RepID=A0A9P4RDB7_9PLEO|nr:sulfatase [Polyplosphaeria fusca]